MRNLILSALLLASAYQTALGEQEGDWLYEVENNQVTITGSWNYTDSWGASGVLIIPSEVNGMPVTRITSFSAQDRTRINSIIIPNSVTSIGNYAFAGWPNITTLNIPNSVTFIGDDAFRECASLTTVTIGSGVTSIGAYAFYLNTSLTSVNIGSGVTSIGEFAFRECPNLTSVMLPSRQTALGDNAFPSSTAISYASEFIYLATNPTFGTALASNSAFVTALANNDAFVTAVANKIKLTGGTYGIATQSGLSSAITTAVEPLVTKTELTSALTESRTAGVNSVLSNPNLWTLYTTSQIQNMAVGDLVLTKNVGGSFTLNYDIEQSADLQTWTTYAPLSLPLTGLPTDKAFVRIKAK